VATDQGRCRLNQKKNKVQNRVSMGGHVALSGILGHRSPGMWGAGPE
jgi:hypothetical protein